MGIIVSDCDLGYLQAVTEEHIKVSGENVSFYSLLDKSLEANPNTDYLYDEPTIDKTTGNEKFKFKGPYAIFGIVKQGPSETVANERGTRADYPDGMAYFAVLTFERESIPEPKYGDVIQWQSRYFDIVDVSESGFIGDTLSHTKWECKIKRTSIFFPERRADTIDVVAP